MDGFEREIEEGVLRRIARAEEVGFLPPPHFVRRGWVEEIEHGTETAMAEIEMLTNPPQSTHRKRPFVDALACARQGDTKAVIDLFESIRESNGLICIELLEDSPSKITPYRVTLAGVRYDPQTRSVIGAGWDRDGCLQRFRIDDETISPAWEIRLAEKMQASGAT